MQSVAFVIDRHGNLNTASLQATAGAAWQGPVAAGTATLVPGAPVAVFRQARRIFTALMVDRDGLLNSASLDVSAGGGWQGPVAIGTAPLVPGSPVSVIKQSTTVFNALAVDRDGLLNVAWLDTSTAEPWQGPVAIGNASLDPGSWIAVPG